MTDFLTRLAERSVGGGEVVRPRVAPLFAPRALIVEDIREVEAEPPRPRAPAAERPAEPAAAVPERRAELAPRPVVPPVVEVSETEPNAPQVERVEEVHEIVVERVVVGTEPAPPVAVGAAPEPQRPAVREQESVGPSERSRSRPEPALRPARTIERRPPARPVVRAAEPAPMPPEPHESWLEPPPAVPERPLAPFATPAAEPPVVRVTIGRVDVRAVLPPPTAAPTPPKRAPRLTLDEYLREGRRS